MVDAIAKGPMGEVDKAIDAKDEVAFDAGYEKLTEGCNACHQAANVGQVVIKSSERIELSRSGFQPAKALSGLTASLAFLRARPFSPRLR